MPTTAEQMNAVYALPLSAWITAAEAGHLLRVTAGTVGRYVKKGKLRARMLEGRIRIRKSDVMVFLEGRRRVGPTDSLLLNSDSVLLRAQSPQLLGR